MSIQRALAIASLAALLPATMFGQRGIMGGRGALTPGRGGAKMARDPGLYVPKYVNAVNLLIEHRPELALSDSQFTQLLAMKRALDSTNAPLVRKLDSLQRLFKRGVPLFSSPSAARRDSLADAHSLVIETVGTITDQIGVAREKVYGLLSSVQLTKAQELEARTEKAVAEENQRAERESGARARGGLGGAPTG